MKLKAKPTLVILAAGIGSRFGGLKQLEPVGPHNQVIIDYSVFDAVKAGFGKAVFVVKKQMEQVVREQLLHRYAGLIETELVFQEIDALPEGFSVPDGRVKPWGTAHALLMAQSAVESPFCVINADDFYGFEAFRDLSDFLTFKASSEHYAMAAYRLKTTLSEHGTVSRGVCEVDQQGFLNSVTEHTSIAQEGSSIKAYEGGQELLLHPETLVSMNCWGCSLSLFDQLHTDFERFLESKGTLMDSEFQLPQVIDSLVKRGIVTVSILDSRSEWFGITYKADLESTRRRIMDKTKQGVYPSTLWSAVNGSSSARTYST
jgi:NDP-sugar pyrophosphorylase family protein